MTENTCWLSDVTEKLVMGLLCEHCTYMYICSYNVHDMNVSKICYILVTIFGVIDHDSGCSIDNFLSWLLKDKIPQYHSTLPYSDFYIHIYQYFTEKFTKFVHFRSLCN